MYICHNPYFNRWFSAINNGANIEDMLAPVTILILIDGFLQLCKACYAVNNEVTSQSLF